MDILKIETDTICSDAALLFRRRQKLQRDLAEVESLLAGKRNEYRDKMRVYGMGLNHFEQACKARGFLL
jgi:hypothetical protein